MNHSQNPHAQLPLLLLYILCDKLSLYIQYFFPYQIFELHTQGVFRGSEPLLTALAEVEESGHAGVIAF